MGIVPWNPKLILEHATLNVGLDSEDSMLPSNNYEALVKLVTQTIQKCLGLKSYEPIDVDPQKGKVQSHVEIIVILFAGV